MKASDLVASWTKRDNKRLTQRQFSIRLPVHIAARIAGLCDMFPTKTRTDIMADLLDSALEELEKSLTHDHSPEDCEIDVIDGMGVYPDTGSYGQYAQAVNKHYEELERELGNEHPSSLLAYCVLRPMRHQDEEDC
ncbi:MAG: hypothetical protein H6937_06255 [Burkholderiales bacterium]|nr:hypothetical protein [Burkholderiales bacterium]MDR4515944.1 hypothetical protein [Nitrosomonas sp.]